MSTTLEPTASERFETEYQQRRAQGIAERFAWPVFYATVREGLALGFLPHAYGFASGPDNPEDRVYRPPTKFGYPPGGLAYPAHAGGPAYPAHAYPAHAGGPAMGTRFQIWCRQNGTPDELRDQPVWEAGDPSFYLHGGHYRTRLRLALPEAFQYCYCIACGDHARRHFIVPEWTADNELVLPAGHWRELLTLRDASAVSAPPQQLDLFAPPPNPTPETPTDYAFLVIASVPAGAPDEARCAWRATAICWGIERIIDEANRRRIAAEVPSLTTEDIADATKSLEEAA